MDIAQKVLQLKDDFDDVYKAGEGGLWDIEKFADGIAHASLQILIRGIGNNGQVNKTVVCRSVVVIELFKASVLHNEDVSHMHKCDSVCRTVFADHCNNIV